MRRLAVISAILGAVAWLLAACADRHGPWLQRPALETITDGHLLITVPRADEWRLLEIAVGLEADYPLTVRAEWPLASLDIHCFVVRIDDGHDPEVVIARLDRDVRIDGAQRMQRFESRSLGYTDRLAEFQDGLRQLNAAAAHRFATGKGVRLALIDSGVDRDHPDLAGRIALAEDFVGDAGGPMAAEIHGTALAGVIAANANDGIGIVGIAPDVALLALRACWQEETDPSGTCSSFTLARAINFAILSHADVVNLSLAGPHDPLLSRLIDTAVAAGIIVVAAGRDDGREGAAGFPASHPDVLVSEPMLMSTTASTTIAAARTGASSSASPLLAPGIDILTTAPGGGYAFRSGSSLASAHVAATVALIAERERLRSPGDVARRLRASASAASGGIDACRAVVVRPPAAAAEALDADEACR